MIGCRAVAKDPALTLDTTEIEAAMWVDRAEVRAALAGDMGAPFMAPPSLAIARHLLEDWARSEEHTSELQSLMRISYAVFCLKKKINKNNTAIKAQPQRCTKTQWNRIVEEHTRVTNETQLVTS